MNLKQRSNYILILLLGLIAFSVYINSLHGNFLIDDQPGILNNARIHDFKAYFSKYFSLHPGVLDEVVRVFIWHISGANPYYFHLFYVLIHVGCVILLFILCNVLFHHVALSFLSSLIFAIHPIHTEAVSWISGGNYAFSSLFFIAAMIFYVKSERSFSFLALSVLSFALCLSVGNAASTLPIMFILYDLFFRKAQVKTLSRMRLLVFFLILAIALLFLGTFFVSRNKFIHMIFYYRGFGYLVVIAKAFAYYLKILYLPLARGLFHSFAFNTFEIQKISPAFFVAIGILVIAIFSFFRYRRSFPALSFGIAWFLVTYAPYSNIIPVCNIISERYLYLPSAGFCILMAALFLKVWEMINKNIARQAILRLMAVASLTSFLGSYTALTIKRNFEYRNVFIYWLSNINNFPDGYLAFNNLAATFYTQGNMENAKAYCWINLMINPNQPYVWCNLGKIYRETGDLKQAKECYEETLKIDKGYYPAYKALDEIEKELANKKKMFMQKKLR